MKIIATLCLTITLNLCFGQASSLSEKFLSTTTDKFTKKELTKSTQYFRMLKPLRATASFTKAVALKSKASHNNKVSRFRDRNQLIGFYAFEYDSKKACIQAMDNLLKCFPNACVKIVRGVAKTGEILPSVYVINGTTIYCIQTFCEDYNEQWNEVVKTFVNTFASKKATVIHAVCEKLEWKNKGDFK